MPDLRFTISGLAVIVLRRSFSTVKRGAGNSSLLTHDFFVLYASFENRQGHVTAISRTRFRFCRLRTALARK